MVSEQYIRWVAIACVYGILATPLIIADGMFFPYITGKNFTFRILVEIGAGATLLLALCNSTYRPKRSALFFAYAALIIVLSLSTVVSENPWKSFWSNFERMEGLITYLHLFVYFLMLPILFRTEKMWQRFFATSIGVSIIIALFGISQLLSVEGTPRIDGTFGNPIYLAVYSLFHIGLSIFLLLRRVALFERVALGIALLLNFLMLYYTATRGTILGFIGGALLTTLGIALFEKEHPLFRKTASGVLIALLVFIGIFFLARESNFVQESPVLSRFANISLSDNTTIARLTNWKMAWEGVKERPLLGWGLESYNYIFNKYYDPSMYRQEQWFDRVHNSVFDFLVAGGVLGLAAYFSLFGGAIWLLYRMWRMHLFSATEASLFSGLLAAYFVHNFFVFDNVTSLILFAAILAYLHFVYTSNQENLDLVAESTLDSRQTIIVAPVLIVATVGLLWYLNWNGIATNRALLKALQSHPGGAEDNYAYFEEALAYNALGRQEVREQLALFALNALRASIGDDLKNRFFTLAETSLQQEIDRNPNDARLQLFMASFLNQTGRYAAALPYAEKARELTPGKQTTYFEIGVSYLNRNMFSEALAAFKTAYDLAPQYGEARIFYAAALIRNGQRSEADALLQEGFGDSVVDHQALLVAYAAVGDYVAVERLMRDRLRKNPNDFNSYLLLTSALIEQGRRSEAILTLQKAIEINSAFKAQGDSYIQAIREGRNP